MAPGDGQTVTCLGYRTSSLPLCLSCPVTLRFGHAQSRKPDQDLFRFITIVSNASMDINIINGYQWYIKFDTIKRAEFKYLCILQRNVAFPLPWTSQS